MFSKKEKKIKKIYKLSLKIQILRTINLRDAIIDLQDVYLKFLSLI